MTADALLSIIAGRDTDGFIEVRCLSPRDRYVRQAWFRVYEPATCRQFIERNAPTFDVFVGAAPRTGRSGGKAAIDHAWCLWVDIDTAEASERVWNFSPAPSLIVRSGTGNNCHAYWALCEPLSPVWVERANRRLAHHLGADMKATDAARILRPPQSLNHKHTPPTSVVVEHVRKSSRIVPVTVASLVKNLADPPSNPPVMRNARPNAQSDDPLLGISADMFYTTLTGREIGHGNVTCPFPEHHEGKERSPSMRLYETTFYCFGCGVGGSVLQFGAHLFEYPRPVRGAAFLELRERLTDALR